MSAKHGGKRPGAGRPAGVKNKVTADLKQTLTEMAREHTGGAIATLAEVMLDGKAPHNARIAAANALLDRGYGKPAQSVDHSSSDGSMTPAPVNGFDITVANALASDSDPASG